MTKAEAIIQRTNDAINKEIKMDRKTEVMSWLEDLTQDDWNVWNSVSEVRNTAKAALELLKEQETTLEKDGHHIRCLNCGEYWCDSDREGNSFPMNFCPNCGRKVKWND